MNTSTYRTLRLAVIALGAIGIFVFIANFFLPPNSKLELLDWVFIIRGAILMFVGIFSAIKLTRNSEHIFFSFFLVNFAINSWLVITAPSWYFGALSWSLTAASFVYSMIMYPGASAPTLYSGYYAAKQKSSWYSATVLFFIKPKNFWLIFFPMLFIFQAVAELLSSTTIHGILNVVAILIGLLYFRISYIVAGKTDRSRLAWVMWGGVVTLLLTSINLILGIFYPQAPVIYSELIIALTAATVSLSVIMSIFFAGFLDSGLVLRGTIVYSIMFLAVIFIFSVIEHYVEHGLSLMLGIESDLINSFLAGFLALAVQPIHKKLEHILPKF